MKEVQQINRDDLLKFLGTQESDLIYRFEHNLDKVMGILEYGDKQYGEQLPWSMADEKFRFRPNELTIWGGESESGKTMMLSHIMANSVYRHEQRWFVASLEMPIHTLQARFFRQACASSCPEEVHVRKAGHLAGDRALAYNTTQRKESDVILGLCHHAASVLNVQHIVIDSLVKVRVKADDRNNLVSFVDGLQDVAKKYDVHIHLVHHLRKPGNDGKGTRRVSKHDLKWGGELSDLADNIILVDRCEYGDNNQQGPGDPDCWIIIAKQRHFPFRGSIPLWFDMSTFQYRTRRNIGPVEYVK